ncbi:ANK repeat containing protein [Candidatus Phycorickettsia trachydisci]|uniref:ANK repeat containing protein n=1 Tax=Candidatus Phycorickettsia trachydisci TaxID=2115978 RepID=A0A2P1P7X0_9RICK|nr:ankyrin repeat domain-containing protein [Candidatus Phycorickettsia trachydisci]AVP87363.1 ANK repeat containing protein [Candidatus Phycorickettsia trachydisci]
MQEYNAKKISEFVDLNILDKIFWEEIERKNKLSTKLYYAVCNGDCTQVHLLIFQGANVNTIDSQGNSLVYIAAMKGRLDILKVLIDHSANFEAVNEKGCKPIYAAAICNQLDTMKYLVQTGADLGLHGYILLNTAVTNNDVILIDLLINRGLNLNTRDELGLSALHYAAQHESLEAIKYLVSKDADINTSSINGYKPIDYAICYNKYHAAMLLCSLGADITGHSWYFKKYSDQISIFGPLAQNLAAVLNIYCTFFQSDQDFKNGLLKNIIVMVKLFEQESNFDRIKEWLEDKNLGSLQELIDQLQALSKSYCKIKNKLKESKLETDNQIYEVMEKIDFNTLSNLLQGYHLELLKKASNLGYIQSIVPSLSRLEYIDVTKNSILSIKELSIVSHLNISDFSKLIDPLNITEVHNDDVEIREILGSINLD